MSDISKIKEGLASEGYSNVSEVSGEDRFSYVIPTLEKLYKELNPCQVTLKNNVIYFNTNERINDNAYMFECQDLYREASSTHTACINLRTDMLIGNGLEPVSADTATLEFINTPNRMGETINDIWEKICTDKEIHNMYSIQLLYNREGKIPEVLHVDVSNVRAMSNNQEEYIPYIHQWAISTKWAEIVNKNRYTPNNSAAEIPNFNPKTFKEDGFRQLLVHRDYAPGNFPYSLPHYNSVLNYVRLDHELSKFHLNKVAGGFFPSVIVKLAGNPNEEEKQRFKNNFIRKYMGPNKEKIMFVWSDADEQNDPKIIPFSTNDDSEIFEILDKITTQKIITAHQVVPDLASLPSQGQSLGGDSNKLIAARDNMLRSVIVPRQKSMLQSLNKIMQVNGLQKLTVTNEEVSTATEETEAPTNN